jgi:hypothetical protein
MLRAARAMCKEILDLDLRRPTARRLVWLMLDEDALGGVLSDKGPSVAIGRAAIELSLLIGHACCSTSSVSIQERRLAPHAGVNCCYNPKHTPRLGFFAGAVF